MRISAFTFLAAGLIVLLFAFFSSLLVTVGSFYGETYHVVVILEANPHRYIDFIIGISLYGILPIAASLALCMIAYIKERGLPTQSLENWLLLIGGGFFVLWGIYYFQGAYTTYFHAIRLANLWNIRNINDSLLAIYAAYGLVGILWLITGTFFITTSVYKLRKAS